MTKLARLSPNFRTFASNHLCQLKRIWGELTAIEKACLGFGGVILAGMVVVAINPEIADSVEEFFSSTPTVPAVSPSLGSK